MKHINKFNETYSDIINDNMTMQDKMASSYQAFLFGCYLSKSELEDRYPQMKKYMTVNK